MKKTFNDASLNNVFAKLGYDFADMRQLMIDTARGVQKQVTKVQAEDKIREMMFNVLELDPKDIDKPKVFKRALKRNKDKLFEVIEDVVDDMLVQGWNNDPFFMRFVEQRNLSDGDKNEFWTEQEVTLAVAKVSGDQHDIFWKISVRIKQFV